MFIGLFFSCLSILGSTSIFLTQFLFPTLRLSSGQLILSLAIADLGNALCAAIGVPNDGILCYTQAIFFNFFGIATSTTSFFITRSIYVIFFYPSPTIANDIANLSIQLMIWGIPGMFSLIPLLMEAYGQDDGFCWIRESLGGHKRFLLILICFYIPLWTTILFHAVVYCNVWRQMRRMMVNSQLLALCYLII
jgi:hypothetical protein